MSAKPTSDMTYHVLSIFISPLGDSRLIAMEECETARDAGEILHTSYVSTNLINKLGVLNSLQNIKMEKGDDVGDHIASMETKFVRFVAKNESVCESMKVAILIWSFPDLDKYTAVSAPINTMKAKSSYGNMS